MLRRDDWERSASVASPSDANAELVTKSQNLKLKCGTVAERSQNGCKQR
jgi:hypothetical protein